MRKRRLTTSAATSVSDDRRLGGDELRHDELGDAGEGEEGERDALRAGVMPGAHRRHPGHEAEGHGADEDGRDVAATREEFAASVRWRWFDNMGQARDPATKAMKKLVLIRHGESIWNKENRFTGWTDVDLSAAGRGGGARRRAPARRRGLRLRRGLHLGAQARHPHAEPRARGDGPAVAPGGEGLAAERAPLRRRCRASTRPRPRRSSATSRCSSGAAATTRRRPRSRPATSATRRATGAMPGSGAQRAAHRVPEGHRGARRCRTGASASRRASRRASACSSRRTATACARW